MIMVFYFFYEINMANSWHVCHCCHEVWYDNVMIIMEDTMNMQRWPWSLLWRSPGTNYPFNFVNWYTGGCPFTFKQPVWKNLATMAWFCHDHTMITIWQPCFLAWSSWFKAWLWYDHHVLHVLFWKKMIF